MSISSLFNIGLTTMQTTNQLLDITGHNIANQNTPGFNRQNAIVESIPSGILNSTGASGSGVRITDIQRMYDSFVTSQLNTENSNLSYWNNFQTGMSQVENVFNEASTTGISPTITKYFTDWQNVAQSPQDDAQRTTLIQDAGYLSSRLNTASAALQNERSQLLSDSQSLANQVNADAAQIADLNAKIAGNAGALDLEDQRDALVQKLNSIIKVSTFSDYTGNITVMIGGTPLVAGIKTFNLSASTDTADNMHFYVALVPGAAQGSVENPEVTPVGGQLKANLDLRDTKIPAYIDKLNAFAIDLADTTNYYQKQGYGVDSSPGGNFFQSLTTQAKYTSVGFTTDPSITVFSVNGGTLSIKLGDNDANPATVTMPSGGGSVPVTGAWTLDDVVNKINSQAGSKVTAAVVDLGTSTAHDYRISIKSNPDGNLGEVRISVNPPIADAPGTGLNLLVTGTSLSSMNVTDPNSTDPKAQYKIDYKYAAGAGYQEEGSTGIYWRVQKSDDGSTWTTINPNLSYNPSVSSTLNASEVNMTTDSSPSTSGYFWRTLEFEGIKVRMDGNGISSTTNPNGETFDVQLDPNAASNIKTVITDPKQVAASTDMFTVDSTNNNVFYNVGAGNITAAIPNGSYDANTLAAALQTALGGSAICTVVYNPNIKQFKIINASGANPINLLWTNTSSTAYKVFGFSNTTDTNIAAGAGNSAVSDNPVSVFSSANKGVPGDNRNATTIANLANGNSFAGTTPVDFYNSLVSDVGVQAAAANNSQQYESNMVDQLTQRQSQVSGVSLDEEAANLVKYQKSYEAAAQMISAADSMLTTLLQMVAKQ